MICVCRTLIRRLRRWSRSNYDVGNLPHLKSLLEFPLTDGCIVCAEAYSRMAQVQQYLDPDTREQYAQGHLDQRVEQVLQEIRDLSIAGAS